MSDPTFVERLRKAEQDGRELITVWDHNPFLFGEAADIIERKDAEIAKLRAALQSIIDQAETVCLWDAQQIARAELVASHIEYENRTIEVMDQCNKLRAALKAAEFGPTGRCPVCFGWDGESESEGDRRHSSVCSTARALSEQIGEGDV